MPTADEQQAKPNPAAFSFFPKFQDYFSWVQSNKHRAIEEEHVRPVRPYTRCDFQKFAYKMCSRNMSQHYAKQACLKELEDVHECMTGDKRAARAYKLKEASRKAGDRVPELHGNFHWVH